MNINKFTKIVYGGLLTQPTEINKRTGIGTKSLPGITYQTNLETEGFPLLGLRKLPLSFIPEIMWFLSGQKSTEWLSKYTKIWDFFTDDDGTVSSAYGHRWREHFGVDQLETVLDKLKKDPSSRHGVVMMWDPATDLTTAQKNVPCPYTFTLNIIGGKLHLHLIIRSNDMVLGFPTDVAGFAFLQLILAQYLSVKVGILTVSISNCHIYENQIDAVTEMMNRGDIETPVFIALPENSFSKARSLDDSFIDAVKTGLVGYMPHEAIKNIPIAI